MYGFPGITDIGAELESAADNSDGAVSHKWLDALARYLDAVETASA
jgi:hypothetical protein